METLEGRAADHLVSCTASDKETCQIVTKLVTWRKLLLGSPFEIQEEPDTYNQLSIKNCPSFLQTMLNTDARPRPQYAELLEWLLTTHRCIGGVRLQLSLDVNTSLSLLRAVCQNRWIKTVSISDIDLSALSTVSSILPRLTNIESFHLTPRKISSDAYVAPLCALLQVSSCLKSLHLWGKISTKEEMIDRLFTTLLRKPTLEELHLEDLSLDSDAYLQTLQWYLSSTPALKVFTVTMNNRPLQMAVLKGVLENRSIEKLSLYFFIGDEESSSLVSRIIKENRVIRSLSILSADEQPLGQHSVYDCWVLPLMENDVLEEVTLPLSILHPTKWSDIFRALPTKETLKMVNVLPISAYSHLREFCTVLKHSGSEEKVYLGYSDRIRDPELLHCKSLWGAELPLVQQAGDRELAAVHQLANCQHLKSICIFIRNGYTKLSLALAEFLKTAAVLESLELRVSCDFLEQAHSPNPCWNVILGSLSQNKSLRQLTVDMCAMSTQDTLNLADSVKQNTCIRQLRLAGIAKASAAVFFRRFSERIEENYILTMVECMGVLHANAVRHWLAVKETTWRNSGLVARAARLKQASHFDRHVTRALDRVARYPALLDEIARRAKLDQEELADLVQDRLVETQYLDGFMRVVGVVKERVICHPAEGGRAQLDDLNEDCWRNIRRYLMVDDVKFDIVQVDCVTME